MVKRGLIVFFFQEYYTPSEMYNKQLIQALICINNEQNCVFLINFEG